MLALGTGLAAVFYIMQGMFGYVTFAMFPSDQLRSIMNNQNILQAPYADDKYMIKFC